jgi:hypothetical protein
MAYYTRLASIYSFLILPYGPTAMGSYLRRLSSRETKSDHSKKREQRLYRDKAGTVLKRSRYQSCGDYRFNDPSLCLHYCQNEQQLRVSYLPGFRRDRVPSTPIYKKELGITKLLSSCKFADPL